MSEDTGDHSPWIKTKMLRGPSAKARPAGSRSDITGLWGQQRRIRRAEALEERKRQLAQKQIIERRGVVGLARLQMLKLARRARRALFGRQPLRQQPASRPGRTGEPSAKTVEINVKFPSPAKLKRLWLRLSKPTAIGLIILVVMAGVTFARFQISHRAPSVRVSGAVSQQTAGPVRGTPSYPTILPAGKDIQSLGGWYLISPPGRDSVYAYSDRISGIQVDISEQPLPVSFKTDTAEHVSQLAQSFNATQKITIDDIIVYIGISAKGPQSLILTKNNLLILLKSTAAIPNNQWAIYIHSLQ